MNIAYVCADPGVPVFGTKGASIHVREVIRTLISLGHHVTLLARRLGGPAPAELASVRVITLPQCDAASAPEREAALQLADPFARTLIRRSGPFDMIYERHALWSCSPMALARDLGVPGILEVNAPLVHEQSAYRSLADRDGAAACAGRALRAASAVVAVSGGVAEHLRAFEPSCAPIAVVPNGVSPDRFHPGVRPALSCAPLGRTIGFVGSLKPWHGVEVLLDAFASLTADHPATHLLIVGDGPQREGLAARAHGLGIAHRVTFTGAVDPATVASYITSMDIATAPYPQQDDCYFSPLKLFEYMACARPIVASATGQVRDVIRDGSNGLLCSPGDPASLARTLGQLLLRADGGLTLGLAARQDVVRSRTWTHVVQRILTLAATSPVGAP